MHLRRFSLQRTLHLGERKVGSFNLRRAAEARLEPGIPQDEIRALEAELEVVVS